MADRLKVMLKPTGDGELTPLLCDEHGVPLPGQLRVEIYTAVDDFARVTVEFGMVEFDAPEVSIKGPAQ